MYSVTFYLLGWLDRGALRNADGFFDHRTWKSPHYSLGLFGAHFIVQALYNKQQTTFAQYIVAENLSITKCTGSDEIAVLGSPGLIYFVVLCRAQERRFFWQLVRVVNESVELLLTMTGRGDRILEQAVHVNAGKDMNSNSFASSLGAMCGEVLVMDGPS